MTSEQVPPILPKTLRVSNLNAHTNESHLALLFKPFGTTNRIFLAIDPVTHASRGFAFVTYEHSIAAQAALGKLHGSEYDNGILCVKWAKPKKG